MNRSSADKDTLALTDSVLHVLADDYGFDLTTGRPVLPSGCVVNEARVPIVRVHLYRPMSPGAGVRPSR